MDIPMISDITVKTSLQNFLKRFYLLPLKDLIIHILLLGYVSGLHTNEDALIKNKEGALMGDAVKPSGD
jgi:hypothetical protein